MVKVEYLKIVVPFLVGFLQDILHCLDIGDVAMLTGFGMEVDKPAFGLPSTNVEYYLLKLAVLDIAVIGLP